ncbi:hypothetical protein RY43_22690 [Salmonella enterica]|uniref:hypothetical protein n=1 Tax=Salmonella enterica TaxID=28901 RepID=UPI0005B63C58|nr:hypothetical protein [Salmonella enterica]HCZ1698913.1 hypothetical protein [Salmonella enterica subsp. enterica serovar Anatum str. 0262]HCZ1716515.1 hypothetical protein [Salmonella enterica subsp. enterica serovar Montevideo str. 0263]EAA4612850.1 hypothetical protein [Salmonella enterica]EAA7955914.1 hypothetical protein [Salmonella enterica]EAM1879261.1 hypothetical protein [Salmonella enterica]
MTQDSVITIVGTIVTILSMIITIWQASEARSYKNQIKSDIRKINLTNISDSLKRAQEEIRKLPTASQDIKRGMRPIELIRKTREHFDIALSTINANGPDGNIRTLIIEAQKRLNSYEITMNEGTPSPQDVHELQSKIQDAVSITSTAIYQMEGKI